MKPANPNPVASALTTLAAAAVLAACGAGASGRPAASGSPTAAPPTASATASPTGSPAPSAIPSRSSSPSARVASDAEDGTTLTLRPGEALSVVLHSTYWQFDASSDPSVLRSQGDAAYAPVLPPRCVPGGGCGTVTAVFRAVRAGRATVAAHRSSCGEAMGCTGNTGRYLLTVVVSS